MSSSKNSSVQLENAPPSHDGEEQPLISTNNGIETFEGGRGGGNGIFSSLSNLLQNTLGAGVFGIPMAIASTGLGGGIGALVIVCVLSAFTLHVLGVLVKENNSKSYQGLITTILGKGVAVFSEILIVLGQFGSSVIALILIRDNLHSVVQYFSNGIVVWYTDRRFLLGMFVLLPGALSFLPRLK